MNPTLLGLFITGILTLFTACSSAQAPIGAGSTVKPGNPATAPIQSIPVEISGNLVFLPIRINNSEPLWFILDSGADALLIDTQRAQALKLKLEGKSKGLGVGENAFDITFAKDVSLSLDGGIELVNQTLSVTSLAFMQPYFGRRIDGIIGYPLFNRYTVEIDYAAQLVKLYDPAMFQYSGAGEKLPFTMVGRLPVASARVAIPGREPVEAKLLLDTGANSEAVLNSPFIETHKLLDDSIKTIRESTSVGLGGKSVIARGRVQYLQVGRFTLEKPILVFAEDQSGALASRDFDGELGGEIFRRFKIIFDYSRQQLILEPNVHFAEPYEETMSGIRLRAEGEDFRTFMVHSIIESSPAAEARVQKADQIISIDGTSTVSFTLDQLKQMFRDEKKMYSLGIKRDGKFRQISIKMRRLI